VIPADRLIRLAPRPKVMSVALVVQLIALIWLPDVLRLVRPEAIPILLSVPSNVPVVTLLIEVLTAHKSVFVLRSVRPFVRD
jgi:hypothetical protein